MFQIDGFFPGSTDDKDESATTRRMTQFLQQFMDRLGHNEHIFIVGTTNFPFKLPEALISRFQLRIHVRLPNTKERRNILKYETHIDENVIEEVVEKTEGFSIRDLHHIINSAKEFKGIRLMSCKFELVDEMYHPVGRLANDANKKDNVKKTFKLEEINAQNICIPKTSIKDLNKAIKKNKKTATADLKLKIETWDEQYGTKLEEETEADPNNDTSIGIPYAFIVFTVSAAVLITTLAFLYPTFSPFIVLGGLFSWGFTIGMCCAPHMPIQRRAN